MFRAPFGESLAQSAGEVNEEAEKTAFLPKTFFGYFREKD
jgi:hypothetical protein